MAGLKGSSIVYLRKKIGKAGAEDALYELFNEEEREVWEKALSFQWIPMSIANQLWIKCTKVLYPNQTLEKGLYQLGYDHAQEDTNTIYRFVFKFITPETILKKTASLWRTHHATGDSYAEKLSPNEVLLSVMNYPDLPEENCQSTSGYIHRLLEIAGAKNIKIIKTKKDSGWVWEINYQ